MSLLRLGAVGLAAAFTHRNDNVDFQYIPSTRDTPGGYYDVCPLNAYVEINPAQAPMNATDCGCPVGSSLRPSARTEFASYIDQSKQGEGVQCVADDEIMCVDCAAYVKASASQKIDTLWNHSLQSALIEPDSQELCSSSIATCVYKSDVSTGTALPADALLHGSTEKVNGRKTFPRFSSLYTESMDASFDRYSDVLPKGRVKAIHNHAVIAKVEYIASKTAKIANELPIGSPPSTTPARPSGLMDKGSSDCILRMSISHPINTTVNANNGMLVSTALKCTRDGTYSANILGLQDARGQGNHAHYFYTQLKNWVPSYTPKIPNFDGVGPNAERFGTSTDAPLRMGLDQFTSADASGVPVETMSQPEILYWVPNGCTAGDADPGTGLKKEAGSCTPFDATASDYAPQKAQGNHYADFSDDTKHDFRDDLIKLPPNTILYDLYAPEKQACYCETIGKDLYGWGKTISLPGSKQPCPVILSNDTDLKCNTTSYPFVKVGQVVSKTKAHMSGFSDSRMFFQHARWGKKENHVCKFDEPVENHNKGTVNPSRFSHDHTLACVAGSSCPGGSHEVTEAMMSNPKETATAAKRAGCPFANFLDAKFAGEAVKREKPSYTCPTNAFATVANPASTNDCACFEGYAKNPAKNTCEASGAYTTYNPAGVTEFAGFEISVPAGKLQSTADWYTSVLGFKLESKATMTLPGNVQKMTQMLRLKTDDGSVGVLLAEQDNSQPVSSGQYYGIHAITFSVKDARSSHAALTAMNLATVAPMAIKADAEQQRQGTTTFMLQDPNGVSLYFTTDAEGGSVTTTPPLPSFWEATPPTQPTLVTSSVSATNPAGIGRIRDAHDLVPETSAAQIWAQDALGMALWQFETPKLEFLAANFNDCYANHQKRVSEKECINAARMFPAATVGLGQVRLHYKYCTSDCTAGFVNRATDNPSHAAGSPSGSFVRPPPPFHSHYQGISQITMSVQSMSRTLQYLSSRNMDLINPMQLGDEKEVFIATNSKTYMKFRRQTAAAPMAPDGKSSRTSSAVIALAVVCGFGVAGVGVANFAGRRKGAGLAVSRDGRATSTVEMGSLPSNSATSNPAYSE
jgi:catechol 2,3-dioxygenase-like lactoylglutathione lyase family enzyme